MKRILYSDRQINLIRESGKVIAKCFELLKKEIKPGITTKQLDTLVAALIAKDGGTAAFLNYAYGEHEPFPASICTSVNDVVIHGIPNDEPLKEGDILSVDIGVRKDNYYADAAWTYPVGKVDENAKKLLLTGEAALMAGIAAFQPRARIVEISKAIQDLAEKDGFTIVREFVGHGVGLTLHEDPQVRNYVDANEKEGKESARAVLKSGTVLAIEPMINEKLPMIKFGAKDWPVQTNDGGRSVHFEHTVAMMADGHVEILTK
jgi:methionyl aminopeptidase